MIAAEIRGQAVERVCDTIADSVSAHGKSVMGWAGALAVATEAGMLGEVVRALRARGYELEVAPAGIVISRKPADVTPICVWCRAFGGNCTEHGAIGRALARGRTT